MTGALTILSAGAARGLVEGLRPGFESGQDMTLNVTFAAVGTIEGLLASGQECDLVITSAPAHARLMAAGLLPTARMAKLGWVRAGLAVRTRDPVPDVSTPNAVADLLLRAGGIYCPDIERATAGVHLIGVLSGLGILGAVRDRLRVFPHGAAAMAALAVASEAQPVGCTQISEIIQASGVRVAGPLPRPWGLATLYGAVPARPAGAGDTRQVDAAKRLVACLTGPRSSQLREHAGFDLVAE